MASEFFRILSSIYGSKEVSSAIDQLRNRLTTTQLQKALEDIGKIYVKEAKYRINNQTDPKGRTFPWNTETTRRYKRKGMSRGYLRYTRGPAIEGPNKRLIWTGKLRKSLQYFVSGNTVIVFSNVPYAKTQQFGADAGDFADYTNLMSGRELGPIPWGPIPARPFLGTNKKTNEAVIAKLGEHLLGDIVANKLGFRTRADRS